VDFGGYLDRYVDRGSEKSKAGLRSIHEWFSSFFPFAIILWWICGGSSVKVGSIGVDLLSILGGGCDFAGLRAVG
jgi:hypothetical protein